MEDLTEKLAEGLFSTAEKYLSSLSVSTFKNRTPKINFRKIKLNRFQNLYSNFNLSADVFNLILPTAVTEKPGVSGELNFNPLRRKKVEDEPLPIKELDIEMSLEDDNETKNESDIDLSVLPLEDIIEEEPFKHPILKPKEVKVEEEKKDITFNLEAESVQDNTNILLSSSLPAVSDTKEDLISSSGKQPSFVWPPVVEKKTQKKIKQKKQKLRKPSVKSKKKPYFLSVNDGETHYKKNENLKGQEDKDSSAFPWSLNAGEHAQIGEASSGGLESELLDIPDSAEALSIVEPLQKEEIISETNNSPDSNQYSASEMSSSFSGEVVYKALFPDVPFEHMPENIINYTEKNISLFNKLLDKFNKLEFGIVVSDGKKKAGKMFGKTGNKLTPIRIIILGGAVATLGYSVWNYLIPVINSNFMDKGNEGVVVKNLFKSKHPTNKVKELLDTKKDKQLTPSDVLEEQGFSPITEEERLSLIQMAREALEGRDDPFGQETVLPKEVIQQKLEEQKNTGPKEFQINRKQLELIGVISTNNKNLALVNVYNADFTVTEDDDKATKDSKLKTSLSMAVPNRLEVSLLDPVEDWYVKQIFKGKSKTEDPIVELVKGDKKFKLKVGQKVLLPEVKPEEEVKPSDETPSSTGDTNTEE